VKLTYPVILLNQPVLYQLIKQFDLITNILHAHVTPMKGWLILNIEGEQEKVEGGLAWVAAQGIHVEVIPEGEAVQWSRGAEVLGC
jgi:ABC-type methionine transport system ATPase subunit